MSTEVLPGSDTRQETDVRPDLSHGDGDHERFAHYVLKDKIVDSAVSGTPVVALCGKVWVPSRDPKRFPVCPECKEIYESLPEGGRRPDELAASGVPVSVTPAARREASASWAVVGSTAAVSPSSTRVSSPAATASVGGGPHAVVGGEADHVQRRHPAGGQPAGQPGPVAV